MLLPGCVKAKARSVPRGVTAVSQRGGKGLLMPETDTSRGYLAAAFGHLGKVDEAQQVWAELMAINPKYILAERLQRSAVQPRQLEMVLEGARKAGLPV